MHLLAAIVLVAERELLELPGDVVGGTSVQRERDTLTVGSRYMLNRQGTAPCVATYTGCCYNKLTH